MSEWTTPGSNGDESEHVLPPPPPDAARQWPSHPTPGPPPPYPGYTNPAYFDPSRVQTPEQAFAARGSNVRLVGILSLLTCPVVGILAIVWSFRVRGDAARAGYPEPRSSVTGRICGACGIVVSVLVWVALIAVQRAQM